MAQTIGNDEFSVTVTRTIRYVWPAVGPITSYFGAGHPTGIDIALMPDQNSPIRAAGGGTVVFAGGDACCSLGLRVEIDHPGGGRTRYGHFESISVEEGATVKQGDILGLGGSTGESDGKHLHFELFQDNALVDPLRYLPQDPASTSNTERISCADATVRLDPETRLDLRIVPRTLSGYEIQTVAYTGIEVSARNLGVQAAKVSILTASLVVPPLVAAAGESMNAGLDVVVASVSGDRQQLSCRLILRTRQTLPNAPGTGERHVGDAPVAEPTATPTRTPISGNVIPPTAPSGVSTPAVRNPTPQRPPVQNPAPQKPPVQRP